MRFVLTNLAGFEEASGELKEFAVGVPRVLTWRGRVFVRDGQSDSAPDDRPWFFEEAFGHAVGHFEALPINGPPVAWSSPTALGQRAAAAGIPIVDNPDVPADEIQVRQPMRRRGQ